MDQSADRQSTASAVTLESSQAYGPNITSGDFSPSSSMLIEQQRTSASVPFTPHKAGGTRNRSLSRVEKRRRDAAGNRSRRLSVYAQTAYLPINAVSIGEIETVLPVRNEIRYAQLTSNDNEVAVITASHFCLMTLSIYENEAPRVDLAVPTADVVHVCESTLDEEAAYVHTTRHGPLSQRDHEKRLLFFKTRTDKEKFIGQLYVGMRSGDGMYVGSEHGEGLLVWEGHMRAVSDVRKMLMTELRNQAGADASAAEHLLEATEHDYAGVAGSQAYFDKVRDMAAGEADLKVYFSAKAACSSNTHDIVVLTNCALYVTKARNFSLVRHRVPYAGIKSVVVDESDPEVILIQFDFGMVKVKGDLLVRMENRHRETFLRILTKMYEEVVVDQLNVTFQDGAFWAKRGFVESMLLRVVDTFNAKHKQEEVTEDSRRSAQWLVWLTTKRLELLVDTLSLAHFEGGQAEFIGRCLVTLCEHCGCVEKLVRHCVRTEIGRCLGRPDNGMFQDTALVARLPLFYMANTGDEFVQVVLSAVMEELMNDSNVANYELQSEQLMYWAGEFLRAIFMARSGDLMPEELKVTVALISEQCSVMNPPQDPYPLIGDFVFSQYFGPAIRDPANHGLVSTPLTDQHHQNLEGISKLVRRVSAFVVDGEQTDALSSFVRNSIPEMTDFLKDIVFADALAVDEIDDGEGWTGLAEVAVAASKVDLRRHNVRLLSAMNRTLGAHIGGFLTAAWAASATHVNAAHEAAAIARGEEPVVTNASIADKVVTTPTSPTAAQLATEEEVKAKQREIDELRARVMEMEREVRSAKIHAAEVDRTAALIHRDLEKERRAHAETRRMLETMELAHLADNADEEPHLSSIRQSSTVLFAESLGSGSSPRSPHRGLLPPREEPPVKFGCPLDTYILPPVVRPSNSKLDPSDL